MGEKFESWLVPSVIEKRADWFYALDVNRKPCYHDQDIARVIQSALNILPTPRFEKEELTINAGGVLSARNKLLGNVLWGHSPSGGTGIDVKATAVDTLILDNTIANYATLLTDNGTGTVHKRNEGLGD